MSPTPLILGRTFDDIINPAGAIEAVKELGFGIGEAIRENQANGGFVLYPNKPNTNLSRQVYHK